MKTKNNKRPEISLPDMPVKSKADDDKFVNFAIKGAMSIFGKFDKPLGKLKLLHNPRHYHKIILNFADDQVFWFLFGLSLSCLIEHFLMSFVDMFIGKIIIALLFIVPFIICFIENDQLGLIGSCFESSFLFTLKVKF